MIKKSNIQAFILGALCMAILLVTPRSYGAVKEYILHQAEFKLYLNGNEYTDQQPILVHEGRAYIPLRAFAQKLGLNLNWSNEGKTVEVNSANNNINSFSLPDNTSIGEGEMTINGLKIKYGKDMSLSSDFVEVENRMYVSKAYVFKSIATNGKVYMFQRDNEVTGDFCITQDLYLKEIISNKIIVNNIPTAIFKNREFIDYDFYLNHIKDIIDN